MNLIQAVKSGLQQSFYWEGRASRRAYWWFSSAILIVSFGGGVVLGLMEGEHPKIALTIYVLLIVLIPASISITVRRLHDIGFSDWWYLWIFVPIVGYIVLLVLMVRRGDKERNEYGPNPEGGVSISE